jgi:hypothetical protein
MTRQVVPGIVLTSAHRHVRTCPAAEQASDRPDLHPATRRDHKCRDRAERLRAREEVARRLPAASRLAITLEETPWTGGVLSIADMFASGGIRAVFNRAG